MIINTTAEVLLVDDEQLNLDIISEYLSAVNCNITTAENGQDAWELLSNSPDKFDVVLLDRMMPVMGGMELLSKIKSSEQLHDIPVILQSARGAQNEIEEGMAEGAYYYIVKPFTKVIIIETVKTAIRHSLSFREYRSLKQGNEEGKLEQQEFSFRTFSDVREIAPYITMKFGLPKSIIIGLVELMFNAIEHGNCELGYQLKSDLLAKGLWEKEITDRLEQEEYQSRAGTLKVELVENNRRVTITDQGKGFDWSQYIEFDHRRMLDNHGRGIALANAVSFKKIEYIDGGRTVIAYID